MNYVFHLIHSCSECCEVFLFSLSRNESWMKLLLWIWQMLESFVHIWIPHINGTATANPQIQTVPNLPCCFFMQAWNRNHFKLSGCVVKSSWVNNMIVCFVGKWTLIPSFFNFEKKVSVLLKPFTTFYTSKKKPLLFYWYVILALNQ